MHSARVVGHVPVPVSEGIEPRARGRARPPFGIAIFRANLRANCIVPAQEGCRSASQQNDGGVGLALERVK